jgi:seryl-tRNA synthetase
MLDLRFIVENIDLVKEKTKQRNSDLDLNPIVDLDLKRRKLIQETEECKKSINELSKQIGMLKREGKNAEDLSSKVKQLKSDIASKEDLLNQIKEKINELLMVIPNILDDSVPVGKDENDNLLYKEFGEKPNFNFEPKAHWDIAENLKLVNFEKGTKLAKSRFSLYVGDGAKLERVLINFMLDIQTKNGYTEIIPPFLVNSATMTGTGQLPKFEKDLFKCEKDELYLIPTAEVPLTNIHSGEILSENDLPINYTAYTPCFRREAGSHGQDVRGLIRQHQFNKVEIVKLVKPENSEKELEKLLENAEEILKLLGLHYRIMTLCSGDVGFSSAKTYDIEVWLPGQNCYREISSCSNFKDFQARRASLKYRPKDAKKPAFVHTLNGSALAVGRTFLAILENYQQSDGTVIIPEVLRSYMGKDKIS